MRELLSRFVCLIKGHKRVRMITEAYHFNTGAYRITDSYYFCNRCDRLLK